MEKRKFGLLGASGATRKVIAVEDHTLLWRRVSRWVSSSLYMRKVVGVVRALFAFSFGDGAATAIAWERVMSAAAAKILVRMYLCLACSITSLPKGIAMSLPPGYLSQVPISSRSINSKAEVGWASYTCGMGASVNLSRGSCQYRLFPFLFPFGGVCSCSSSRRACRGVGRLPVGGASFSLLGWFWDRIMFTCSGVDRACWGGSSTCMPEGKAIGEGGRGPRRKGLAGCCPIGEGDGGGDGEPSIDACWNGRVGAGLGLAVGGAEALVRVVWGELSRVASSGTEMDMSVGVGGSRAVPRPMSLVCSIRGGC